jgi:dolichyl-phosphate-mannose-protein mannosyltransferase
MATRGALRLDPAIPEGSSVPQSTAEGMTVLGLCCAALTIRVITMVLTIDESGDGPTHAMQAYEWSSHPYFATHGVWLPGFTYWAGICALVIHRPLIAPRLVNLIFGTLTIPVFYALIRRLCGPIVAVLSTVTLAVLPLHVGVSVSSLTEASFLFFIIAALLCLTRTVGGGDIRIMPLGLFLLFFDLAEMTRYEAWPLIPLVLAYLYWRSRKASTIIVSAVILFIFPIGWSVGSYLNFGNAFYGILQGIQPLEVGAAVSVPTAIANVARQGISHLGWLLSVAVLWGLIGELARSMRGAVNAERTAYAILVSAVWLLIVGSARSVGPALYDRYLLTGYVLALPFATLPYVRHWGYYRHCIVIGVLFSLGSVAGAYVAHRPTVWVTGTQPAEIVELAHWLPRTLYRNDAVLLTKMNWKSTYLPLYLPQLSGRFFIVSVWVDDEALRRFIDEREPALLITQEEDAPYRVRIERVLGHAIPAESRVYVAEQVEVYDLSNLVRHRGKDEM